MDQNLLELIKPLLEHVARIRRYGYTDFETPEQKMTIKTVIDHIYPNTKLDMSCSSCVAQYLEIIQSYYNENYKGPETKPEPVVEVKIEAPKPDPVEDAKIKLSRKEILERARAARKQQ